MALVVVAGCSDGESASAVAGSRAEEPTSVAAGLEDRSDERREVAVVIEAASGALRTGAGTLRPLFLGTLLRASDQVQPRSGRVRVVCPSLRAVATDGAQSVAELCGAQRSPYLVQGIARFQAARGGGPMAYPRLIAPRSSAVYELRPVLRWTALEGVQRYTISVAGPGVRDTWEAEGTSWQYPAAAPELEPGAEYQVVVEAGGHSSSEEIGGPFVFRVLSDVERGDVLRGLDAVAALDAPPELSRFVTALLLARQRAHADAAQTLETLAEGPLAARVALRLAEEYVAIGALDEALRSAARSSRAADAEADLSTQADAEALSARIQIQLGRQKRAVAHRDTALALYQRLGELDAAAKLEEEGREW